MPGSELSVLLTGDALITRPYLIDSAARRAFVNLVRGVDAALTNVEAPFNDYVGPPATNTGIHLSTAPERADDLLRVGFNLFAAANNHPLDYGLEGFHRHLTAMRERNMVFAGAGEDATAASAPAFLDTPNGRIGLVACASSLGAGWPAADATSVDARPGVSALGFTTTYRLDPARFAALRGIQDVLGLAEHERYELDTGYVLPLPDARSTRLFGGLVTEADHPGMTSTPNPADLARVRAAVTTAREQADLVIVYLHTQEHEAAVDQPAAFAVDFAHACVDAGAHIVSASGPHVMRGVELYRNRPILHGLGNLWFQYDQLDRLPADTLAAYNLPPTTTAATFADAAMAGFRREPRYWESAVARCTFEGDRLTGLVLHPVTSGFGQPDGQRGAPQAAAPEDAHRILDNVFALSAAFGSRFSTDGETATLRR
jgi:poly-gamma-glutamate synthesis protein (capsule biosynthesis protein)